MKNCRMILLLTLGIMLLSPVPPLLASGILVPGLGGNFSSPVEDKVSAVVWNPAALGQLEGTNIFIDVPITRLKLSVDMEDPVTEEKSKVESILIAPPPFIGASSNFGLEKLTFGLGLYAAAGGGCDYPADGPQRFQIIKANVRHYYVTPTVAWEILPDLMVGLGFSYIYAGLDVELSFLIERFELETSEKNVSGSSFGWDIGILWKPMEKLDIGLSYVSQTNYNLNGDLRATLEGFPWPVSGTFQVDYKIPQYINLGVEYRPSPKWEVDLALRWEDWSVHDYMKVTNVDINKPEDIPDEMWNIILSLVGPLAEGLTMERAYEDTFGVKLSGAYWLMDELKIGAGFGWEQGAVPSATTGGPSFGTDTISFFGAGEYEVFIENLILGLGYQHIHFKDLTVTDSRMDPPANGDYTGNVNLISLNFAYKF